MSWPVATLNDLCAPDRFSIAIGPFGSRMKADCYVPAGVPVIRGTNLSSGRTWTGNWVYVSEDFAAGLPNCIALPGDLVLPHRGAIGEVGIVPSDGRKYIISSSLMKIRLNPNKAISEYVFYYLSSAEGRHEILRFGSQVGTPGIGQPLSSLRQMRVPLPPIHDQQAIATLLSNLDEKIELNRRMNETLEASARALFQDWFVDFGPTRAKAEGRPAWLAPDLWSLFPDRLGDDGLPEGWAMGRLSELVEVSPSEPLKRGTVAPYLDMAAIPTTGPNADQPVPREYGSGTRFRNGDALLARITPCLENGKTAFVNNLPEGAIGWGSTEFIVLRSKPPVPAAVSYLLARDGDFRRHAIHSMTGTSGRQRADSSSIAAYSVSLPSDSKLWSSLGEIINPLFDRIAFNAAEAEILADTRDALLPKLMAGDIRVSSVDTKVIDSL
jgi:type I restriction enzyme S subunit